MRHLTTILLYMTCISLCCYDAGNALSLKSSISSSKPIDSTIVATYAARNVADKDLRTAWCSNHRISPSLWIEIDYSRTVPLSGLGLVNGYAKNSEVYQKNARPKTITIIGDERKLANVLLEDKMEPQWVPFVESSAKRYKIVIDEVYPGAKFDDVCLSEIFDDARILQGYEMVKSIDDRFGDRALSDKEIKQYVKPLITKYYHPARQKNDYVDVDVFWTVVSWRASKMDVRGLRLLIDLLYADEGMPELQVESQDAIGALIMRYFENNVTDSVLTVITDKKQLNKSEIADYYFLYVSQTDEQKHSKELKGLLKHMRQVRRVLKSGTP